MGCDIHLYTERRHKKDDKEIWICCDHFRRNPYSILYPEELNEKEWGIVSIYDHRDYNLFATLADVRNYDHVIPIDKPRGLPEDVSKDVYNESLRWGSDGHSHSWFTAKELFIYQRRHPTKRHEGILYPDDAKKLDEEGIIPTSWCQWTNVKGAEKRVWVEPGSSVDELVEVVKKRMAEEFWIFDFLNNDEKEKKFSEHADDFRIVFWFDN